MKFLIPLLVILSTFVSAQQKGPFEAEVLSIRQKYDTVWDASRETVVFTGSSSIRMWKDIGAVFPGHQIINSGFGGSKTLDLLRYSDELILAYRPKKVFIYEGDNDIAARLTTRTIMDHTVQLIQKIKETDPTIQIVLISAKPSIARWNYRSKYKRLNRKFRRLCERDTSLSFANVWDVMLDRRKVKTDLFIADGLHMNAKGYELWHSVLKEYMD
ncbi:MAG: GDSL-type esterase/lipase family protein [Sediminicola sp.]|tara:strand:- start:17372 stop:18016 length:645 start_codon:yes stop_codon:yes gene_type:complete